MPLCARYTSSAVVCIECWLIAPESRPSHSKWSTDSCESCTRACAPSYRWMMIYECRCLSWYYKVIRDSGHRGMPRQHGSSSSRSEPSRGKRRQTYRCRHRRSFVFHGRRELCGMCSCCRPFCKAIILFYRNALEWYPTEIRWRRPVVVVSYTSRSRPGFSPFGGGAHPSPARKPIFLHTRFRDGRLGQSRTDCGLTGSRHHIKANGRHRAHVDASCKYQSVGCDWRTAQRKATKLNNKFLSSCAVQKPSI